MKTLILISGPANSGKTSLAELLVYAHGLGEQWEKQTVTHWEPNFYFYDEMGNYFYDKDKLSQAHTQCKITIKGAMKRGDNVVIVSHQFENSWQKKYYLNLAKQYGYDTQEIFVKSTFKEKSTTVDPLVRETNKQLSLVAA